MNRKFIKKLDKKIGISTVKNQIHTINVMLVFLIIAALYAVYLNHTGIMLSYGIIVASVAMLALAGFLSFRIRLQVKLEGMKLDYRKVLVTPVVAEMYEKGTFSGSGSLTEREILNTNLFSDGYEYKYDSKNECKGVYKDIVFEASDVKETKANTNMSVIGRIFQFEIPTENVNPVIFASATAPAIERMTGQLKVFETGNDEIDKRYMTYAFDENEAKNMINSSLEFKLLSIIKMGLGRVVKICFYNNKVCVYYTSDHLSFEEVLTKKHKTAEEVHNTVKTLSIIDKLIDILK